MQPPEELIGPLLIAKGWMLAAAESCTGGLIGHRITNIPGSSEYYLGSVTAYAYEAKERLLGVHHKTLFDHGAVSRETVREMAAGIRRALAAEVGVAVSGIAGPGGGMPNKPVGLVWFGLSTPTGEWEFQHQFSGSRVEVKEQSARKALELVLNYLRQGYPEID